ncbi:GNAT family N-acetyltransferase [Microlunatus sp. GCM10028923]|uniref:GNAT family N-acetyltransferase n=1 Tax=Microlunatus sp. GCM10028923 TaxID=3273400 RepID=UPI0036064C68
MITLRRLDERDRLGFEADGMLPGPVDGLRWHPEYPTENTLIGYRLSVEAGQPEPDTTPWWMYHVVRDREVVGNIGFHGPPDDHGTVEIGYDIVDSLWGQGIGSAACAAIVGIARNAGAGQVIAETEPDNVGSQRVLIKNGFVRFGAEEPGAVRFRLRW